MRDGQKLKSLEIYRGIAALMVVLFHYHFYMTEYLNKSPTMARIFEGGHAGVEFFFVLSGFIIYLIHSKDIGDPDSARDFLRKRMIRILPLYWIVITVSLVSFLAHPGWGGSKGLTLHNVVFDYLLLPTGGNRILAPAWTLKAEALFYASFCIAIFRPAIGVAAFVVWQLAIVVSNAWAALQGGNFDNPYVNYVFDIHNIGFGIGVACGWACSAAWTLSARRAQLLLALGLLGVLSVMAFEGVENLNFSNLQPFPERTLISISYTLSFALIIIASVRLEEIFKPAFDRRLVLFGASSYSLYLIHDPLVSFMDKAAARFRTLVDGHENALYLIEVCLAVAVAIAIHRFVEKPVTDSLKRIARRGASGKTELKTDAPIRSLKCQQNL